MRLYSRTGGTRSDTRYGSFTPDANGAFDFPDALSAELRGNPEWETDVERASRIATEELDKYRDPATLLAAVREMGANQSLLATALATALGLGNAPTAEAAPAAPPAPAALAVPAQAAVAAATDAPVEVPAEVPVEDAAAVDASTPEVPALTDAAADASPASAAPKAGRTGRKAAAAPVSPTK